MPTYPYPSTHYQFRPPCLLALLGVAIAAAWWLVDTIAGCVAR